MRAKGLPSDGTRESGQVVVLVALMFVPLCLLVGLAVDLGVMFENKARLQRAVDAAALSTSQALYDPNVTSAAISEKAEQFLAANLLGGPAVSTWSATRGTGADSNQVVVSATASAETLFVRIVPGLSTVWMSAQATAVLDSYAETQLKPDGTFGKEGRVNPSVFGPGARYDYGDAYSPANLVSGAPNPEHDLLPYGYLFRIYVPPDYVANTGSNQVKIELFDPDCWNQDPAANEMYWTKNGVNYFSNPPLGSVKNPDWTNDNGGTPNRANAYIVLDGLGPGWNKYYRIDESRSPSPNGSQSWSTSYITTTQYTLWHFRANQVNLNPFDDPTTLSDVGVVNGVGTYIATKAYSDNSEGTDLKWVTPTGFTLNLSGYDAEEDGSWNFYLYVRTMAGSSENGFDIRTGPPGQSEESDVNDQGAHTWSSGGTMIFARRAYPMNNNAQSNQAYIVRLSQVPVAAAGSTLLVRHYDNDNSTGTNLPFYLEPCNGSADVSVLTGKLSGNGVWYASSLPGPDAIVIPPKGSAAFPGNCTSAWLKASYQSASQDTSVWELLYIRPRLLQ